jgi:hypothetical protein
MEVYLLRDYTVPVVFVVLDSVVVFADCFAVLNDIVVLVASSRAAPSRRGEAAESNVKKASTSERALFICSLRLNTNNTLAKISLASNFPANIEAVPFGLCVGALENTGILCSHRRANYTHRAGDILTIKERLFLPLSLIRTLR